MPSAALQRLRRSARRLLIRFGGEETFQRYEATPDWDAGSESASAVGSPVKAAIARDEERTRKAGSGDDGDRKVAVSEEVWHVEVLAFDPGGLDASWRVTLDGVERRIASAVLCEDETYYVVRLGTGGR